MSKVAWIVLGAVLIGIGGGVAIGTGGAYGLGLMVPGAILILLETRRAAELRLSEGQGAVALLVLATGASVLIVVHVVEGWDQAIIESAALIAIPPLAFSGALEGWRIARRNARRGQDKLGGG